MYNNSLVREFLLGRVSVTLPSGKILNMEAPIYGVLPSEDDLEFLKGVKKHETI